EQRLKELAKKPHTSLTTAASPVSTSAGGIMTAPAIDIFSTPSSSNSTSKLPNDLLDLQQPTFHPSVLPMSAASQVASTWGDPFSATVDAVDDAIPSLNPFLTKSSGDVHPPISSDVSTFTTRTPTHEMFVGFTPSPVAQPSAGLNVDFESVFGNKSTNVIVDSGGFDELGGLLKPTVASQNQSLPVAKLPPNKLVSDDLDSSLANLVGSRYRAQS
ncbi:Phosphatidylinositol-binding clathrin assembly protein, partial [Eschrichtius robustus]|nr:Phosphatidylinositol-binding clathrin assembly protein [Eschrichtius robustus]